MFKRAVIFFATVFLLAESSLACVGKTVNVGYVDTKNEEIMGNIFARLILERTGTTAKLKKYNNTTSLLNAAQAGDVDLFVFSNEQIKSVTNGKTKDEAKTEFNVKFNLVWLKSVSAENQEYLVPIIRKDTLKKFPALPKLIEKLEGKLNTKILTELNSQLKEKSMKDVVKDFLKENKLI